MASSRVDVWLGSSLGLIKGVRLDPLQCTNYLPGGVALAQTDKSREMLCMCREASDDSVVYVGLRSGAVQAFDCSERRFTVECDITAGVGTLVGLAKHDKILITCTDEGVLSYWPPGEEKWEVDVGPQASCMAASPLVSLQVATGGKENPLKLWDGNHTTAPLFTAKNVRPDQLDLRVPVWDTQVVFTPDSGPQPILVTGTGYGDVRLYDTRAQRRPLFSTKYGTEPVTSLNLTPDGRYCVLGNSVGELARFDLRAGSMLSQYKGFGGAVTAVQVCRNGSKLAACGLDRYLRVYCLERPTLLHQVYLKLQCRCMLFSVSYSGEGETGEGEGGEVRGEGRGEEEDSDADEVWATMEVVEDVAKKVTVHKRRAATQPRGTPRKRGRTGTSDRQTSHSSQ